MFLRNVALNFWKIVLFLAALAIVFYVLIEFRLWSMEWTEYFLKVGKWEEIVFISLVIAAVSIVVLKLFQWHVRLQSRRR